MKAQQYIRYETPEVVCELTLSVTIKEPTYIIAQMPSNEAIALVKALKIKHNGNMNKVWVELDQLAIEILGYPISPKFKNAKIDF